MLYLANLTLDHKTQELTEQKLLSQMLNRVIENILDSNYEITEKEVKELFDKQLKLIKTANEEKKKKIRKLLLEKLENEQDNYMKDWKMLEETRIC